MTKGLTAQSSSKLGHKMSLHRVWGGRGMGDRRGQCVGM